MRRSFLVAALVVAVAGLTYWAVPSADSSVEVTAAGAAVETSAKADCPASSSCPAAAKAATCPQAKAETCPQATTETCPQAKAAACPETAAESAAAGCCPAESDDQTADEV